MIKEKAKRPHYNKMEIVPLTDEMILSALNRITGYEKKVIERYRSVSHTLVSYNTPSVLMFMEAKELFSLGYFRATILLCRAVAEYLAYELFIELIELQGKIEDIESIAENLDFRKLVNEFLFRKNNPLIKRGEAKRLFNYLYDLGNIWIHPKTNQKKLSTEKEATQAIQLLSRLMKSERNMANDFEVINGKLKKVADAPNRLRSVTNSISEASEW